MPFGGVALELGDKYKKLQRKPYEYADIVYRYIAAHNGQELDLKDFGVDDLYTTVEMHTVTRIEEHPGITVTEIAAETNRTKGAVSQIMTKLEKKGLIRREKHPENPRRTSLYVTQEGLALSIAHKKYDDTSMSRVLDYLISLHGYVYVEKFFQILESYSNLLCVSKDEEE